MLDARNDRWRLRRLTSLPAHRSVGSYHGWRRPTAGHTAIVLFGAARHVGRSLATGARRWLGCQVICGDPGRFQFFWACWRANAQIGTVCAPMGVEEEYFLVDPHTRTPEPAGARVARLASETLGDSVCGEFTQEQIE